MNLTDANSLTMPHRGGFEQCYSGQVGVCHDSGLNLVQHVSQRRNNLQELVPTLGQLAARTEGTSAASTVVADAGYFSRDNATFCEVAGFAPLISVRGANSTLCLFGCGWHQQHIRRSLTRQNQSRA